MKHLWIIAVLGVTACAPVPDDAQPVAAVPAPEPIEATALDGETVEEPGTEPYDPSTDLTLISCGAHEVLDLIGTPAVNALPRLPENHRMIRPGDVVTQDYNTNRMNVFVDGSGQITKIDCG